MTGGNTAQVVASDLWARFEPLIHAVTDSLGDRFGLSGGALGAQAGGNNRGVELIACKAFVRARSPTFHNINGPPTHLLKSPIYISDNFADVGKKTQDDQASTSGKLQEVLI